jgi:replicative DNA helicase
VSPSLDLVPDDHHSNDDGSARLSAAWDEMALLGAVMQGFPDVHALAQIVTGEDFGNPYHEGIWEAILKVHGRGDQPTPVLVMHEMGSQAHKLPGGPLYLSNLMNPLQVIPAQAPQYASNVREASIWRQIDALGIRCQQGAREVDLSSKEFLAEVSQWFAGIHQHESGGLSDIRSALEEVIDVAEHGEAASVPTPWSDLNAILGGFFPGQLVILGARPGVGKSIALENIATHVVRECGMEVVYVSLEMSAKEVMQRTLAWTAKVDLTKIRTGNGVLAEAEWARINAAHSVISAQEHITFADRQGQTLAQIRAAAMAGYQGARRRGKTLALVVVDYAQLIKVTMRGSMTRQVAMGEVSRGLKELARELNVCVVCAAQLNRGPEQRASKRPMMSDLRETGDFEQDADVVLLLHEIEEEDGDGRHVIKTGDVDLIVDKQRNGPTGVRSVRKYGHLAKFSSI